MHPFGALYENTHYVGGARLKEACGPNSLQQLRFVYNGNYDEQIRTCDVKERPDRRGAAVSAWVRGDGNLSQGVFFPNLLSPWKGTRVDTPIDTVALAELRKVLKEDGFVGFKPAGLRLPSNEYYWFVTGCLDGRFHANAWLYPSKRFKGLKFPEKLLAFDRTGIVFRAAETGKQHEGNPDSRSNRRNESNYSSQIELGANGIVGTGGLF